MKFLNQQTLCVTDLEIKSEKLANNSRYSEQMHKIFKNVALGNQLSQKEVASIARLTLREDLWCKLESENMYVHFGYDYYMFIGATKTSDSLIAKIEKSGLFVEEFESPYLEETDEESLN